MLSMLPAGVPGIGVVSLLACPGWAFVAAVTGLAVGGNHVRPADGVNSGRVEAVAKNLFRDAMVEIWC